MNKRFLIMCLLFLTIFSCKKSENSNKIIFEGITERDNNGSPINDIDDTDWNFNDSWSMQEKELFFETGFDNCILSNENIICYPNPCGSLCLLRLIEFENYSASIRLVDNNLNILLAKDSIEENLIYLPMENMESGKIYRVYYKLLAEDCELKGHGDILIE